MLILISLSREITLEHTQSVRNHVSMVRDAPRGTWATVRPGLLNNPTSAKGAVKETSGTSGTTDSPVSPMAPRRQHPCANLEAPTGRARKRQKAVREAVGLPPDGGEGRSVAVSASGSLGAGAVAQYERWLRARGVRWKEAKLATTDEGVSAGLGCVATAAIADGEALCRVPREACLGASAAVEGGDEKALERDTQQQMATTVLAELALGDVSRWAPLLRMASPAGCPWTWPARWRSWLDGTELEEVLRQKMERLEAEWCHVKARRVEAAGGGGPHEYRQACALVASHLNPWFGGAIVPFNLTLNFAWQPNVRFAAEGGEVVGRAARAIRPGESAALHAPSIRLPCTIHASSMHLPPPCMHLPRAFHAPPRTTIQRAIQPGEEDEASPSPPPSSSPPPSPSLRRGALAGVCIISLHLASSPFISLRACRRGALAGVRGVDRRAHLPLRLRAGASA